MKEISVVIPVYGCRDCLVELHLQLTEVLGAPTFPSYEIIFVDDCSNDEAWELIEALARKDSHIKGIKFSRNFGQHAAITAGLAESNGKYAVVMDCDLQDSPREIPRLYLKTQEGYDIVYSKRIEKKFSLMRKLFSRLFFKLMGFADVKGIKFDSSFTGFSIISRKVIDSFLMFQERDRHYLFILRWLGFNSTYIEYEHAPRFCGKSSYTFLKLVNFAFQGILSQTTTLLKMVVFLGFAISFMGFCLGGFFLIRYFFNILPSGWTSIIVSSLLMGGIIISTVGILGLYIAKIFEQIKGRPLYIIDNKVNT